MKYISDIPIFIILLGAIYSAFAQNPDTTFSVGGFITNYKPDKAVCIAMFSSNDDFKKCEPYKTLRFANDKLPPDTLLYVFSKVDPGEYIIAAYQDINGDNKMNKGLFGPTEPYRIYKPNYGIFGPKFAKCKFQVSGSITSADFALK